jgi:hypothetical protein
LGAELLGVQNAYVLPEGPNQFYLHAAKLRFLPRSIKSATGSEEEPILGCLRRLSMMQAQATRWKAPEKPYGLPVDKGPVH